MGVAEEKSPAGVVEVCSVPDNDTFVDPKEERAFVWRLDCIFLVVGFLGYTFKYLDQSNIVSFCQLSIMSDGFGHDQLSREEITTANLTRVMRTCLA